MKAIQSVTSFQSLDLIRSFLENSFLIIFTFGEKIMPIKYNLIKWAKILQSCFYYDNRNFILPNRIPIFITFDHV